MTDYALTVDDVMLVAGCDEKQAQHILRMNGWLSDRVCDLTPEEQSRRSVKQRELLEFLRGDGEVEVPT